MEKTKPGKASQEVIGKLKRPFSSPFKIQSDRKQYNSKSEKWKENLVESKSKFNDINNESALQLHNRLKELEK